MLEHLHCTLLQLIPQLPRCTLYSTVVQYCNSVPKVHWAPGLHSWCTLHSTVVQLGSQLPSELSALSRALPWICQIVTLWCNRFSQIICWASTSLFWCWPPEPRFSTLFDAGKKLYLQKVDREDLSLYLHLVNCWYESGEVWTTFYAHTSPIRC